MFCADQAHALLVRNLINQVKSSTDPNYCQHVTADDGKLASTCTLSGQRKDHPHGPDHVPKALDGVDARNIRNIVLLRPINSMIEFKQIIGRGTRLYDGKDSRLFSGTSYGLTSSRQSLVRLHLPAFVYAMLRRPDAPSTAKSPGSRWTSR